MPEEIGWTEVPGVSLTGGMFGLRATGTAMEPLIPDGSWCLFRLGESLFTDGMLALEVRYALLEDSQVSMGLLHVGNTIDADEHDTSVVQSLAIDEFTEILVVGDQR